MALNSLQVLTIAQPIEQCLYTQWNTCILFLLLVRTGANGRVIFAALQNIPFSSIAFLQPHNTYEIAK